MRTYSLTTVITVGILSAAVAFGVATIYRDNIREAKNIAETRLYLDCLETRTTDGITMDSELRKKTSYHLELDYLRRNFDHATDVFAKDKPDYVQSDVVARVGTLRRLLDAHEGQKETASIPVSYNTETFNPPVTEHVAKKDSCETKDYFTF